MAAALPAVDLVVAEEQHHRRHHAGRGRGGQPDEVSAVAHSRVHVEAGEPERAADHEQERAEPRRPPEPAEGQRVQHEGGRHAERHHVGERVELDAELGRGPREARHLAVQDVHHHRDEDGDGRLDEARLGGEHEGEEAAEEVAGGEQARQEEDAPPRVLAQLLPAPPARHARTLAAPVPSPHRSTPMIVSPPLTLSPGRTRISVVARHEQIGPRAEPDQPEALAGLELVARPHPADDAPRQPRRRSALTATRAASLSRSHRAALVVLRGLGPVRREKAPRRVLHLPRRARRSATG